MIELNLSASYVSATGSPWLWPWCLFRIKRCGSLGSLSAFTDYAQFNNLQRKQLTIYVMNGNDGDTVFLTHFTHHNKQNHRIARRMSNVRRQRCACCANAFCFTAYVRYHMSVRATTPIVFNLSAVTWHMIRRQASFIVVDWMFLKHTTWPTQDCMFNCELMGRAPTQLKTRVQACSYSKLNVE